MDLRMRMQRPPTCYYQMTLTLVGLLLLPVAASGATVPPRGGSMNEAEVLDYCAKEKFEVTCDAGHVILMTMAMYGRMRSGRCIGGVALGCQTDVIDYMDAMCSGKRSCVVKVNDIDLHATPCPKDYKSYLEASYVCVPAVNTTSCQSKLSQHLVGPRGYITGHVADGVLASPRCTFSVEVEVGQKVDIYVYSFPQKLVSGMSRSAGQITTDCGNHMTLEDGDKQTVTNLCVDSRNQRHRKVFTSTANRLGIHIKHGRSKHSSDSRFLIEYRAVGCADIKVQKNSWMERTGENLVVKCNITGDIWYLTCQRNQWIGQIGNCSNFLDANGLEAIFGDGIPFQQGIALAVGVGIVVGAILGALLLLCVWTIRKGSHELNTTKGVQETTRLQTKIKTSSRHQESVKPPIRQVEVASPDGKSRYDDRNHYPSLLTQERSTPETAAYEYTHVWDPHFPSMGTAKPAGCKEKETLKMVPIGQTSLRLDGTATTTTCSAHPGGTTITTTKPLVDPRPSRVHVYETPRGNTAHVEEGMDSCRIRTGEFPMYYDLDPEGKCDHMTGKVVRGKAV